MLRPHLSTPWLVGAGVLMGFTIIVGFEFVVDALYPLRPVRLSVRILYILRGVVLAGALVGLALFVLHERNATLADDRRRLYALLENLPLGACVVDRRGRQVFVNHAARGLNVTAANVPRRGRKDKTTRALHTGSDTAFGHDELPLVAALRQQTLAEVRDMEVFEADGRRHAYQVFASPVTDRRGDAEFAIALFRDITEELRRERERARFVAVVDASSEAIIGYGPDGVVRSWNRGARETYGYEDEEIVGRHIMSLVPPDRHDEHRELLRMVLHGARVREQESERIRKDGTRIPVSVSLAPVRDNLGQVIGISSVSRDITAQRELQAQQLRAAEKEAQVRQMRTYDRAKRRFLDHAAHELKTPLTPLMLEVGMIEHLESENPDPEVRASVGRLGRSARRLLRVTDQLIEVVRLEARVGTTDPTVFDVVHTAEDVVEAVRPDLREGLTLTRTGADHAFVSGREAEIRRTIAHLVANAAKYTDGAGSIEVEVRDRGHGAEVEVRDEGRGFDAEQAENLFDPFTQLDPDAYVEGGIGLGLYEVRLIVEGHGGRVWASSQGRGKGATVGFFLPERILDVPPDAAPEGHAEAGPGGREGRPPAATGGVERHAGAAK